MNLRAILVVGLLVIVTGCSRPQDSSPAVIKVGVRDDGRPFFDWEGTMMFETSSSGLVHWSSGAEAHASFSRPSWKGSLEVHLILKDSDDGRYSIEGTMTSPVSTRMELLGTSSSENEADSMLSFPAGTSKVRFDGKLHSTYAKES
jgi:hypothetical protein